MKKLLMVVNVDWFFLSHRKDIAIKAQEAGWDVTIVAHDTGKGDVIRNLGLKFINLPIDSTGMNPLHELKTLKFLCGLYSKNRDAIVHHVGLKNILWGSLAARKEKVKGVVNAISGLGSLFVNEQSLLNKALIKVLKFSHKHRNLKVIFQNHDDERLFDDKHVVTPDQKRFIKGSGVDLNDFAFVPMPTEGKIKVIFTGRMIEEKGVLILIEAAEKLRKDFEDTVEFQLVGGLYPNPKALTKEDIESRCDGKYITWLGYRTDVKDLLSAASIVAFPSYYREGLPKSLIEANAIGRPIITTDSIGCKDTVEDDVNGFLIPIKDSHALADKLRILLTDSELRIKMGKAARTIAERNFSLSDVVDKHLKIYDELYTDAK